MRGGMDGAIRQDNQDSRVNRVGLAVAVTAVPAVVFPAFRVVPGVPEVAFPTIPAVKAVEDGLLSGNLMITKNTIVITAGDMVVVMAPTVPTLWEALAGKVEGQARAQAVAVAVPAERELVEEQEVEEELAAPDIDLGRQRDKFSLPETCLARGTNHGLGSL